MPQWSAEPQRLRVQPAPDLTIPNVVLCPVCQRRMTASLLLTHHLDDHRHGRFGAERTGPIQVEITLLVGKAEDAAPVA